MGERRSGADDRSDAPSIAQLAAALQWALETKPGRGRDERRDQATDVEPLRRVPAIAGALDPEADTEALKAGALRVLEDRLHRLPKDDREVAAILMDFHTPIGERTRLIAELRDIPIEAARRRRDQTIHRMASLLRETGPDQPRIVAVTDPQVEGRRFRIEIALALAGLSLTVIGILVGVFNDGIRDRFTGDNSTSAATAAVGQSEPDNQGDATPAAPSSSTSTSSASTGSTSITTSSTTTGQTTTGPTTTAEDPGPSPDDGAEPPDGDVYLPMRPDSREVEFAAPGDVLVLDVEVGRSGWLVLDLDCGYQINTYPEHDGPMTVAAHTGTPYWVPPNPVRDCNHDIVQGPVVPGHYYYTVQVDPDEPEPRRVAMIPRFVDPPVGRSWDGRAILPQIEVRRSDSFANTLSPGTAHSHLNVLTTGDRLLFAFDCNVAKPPTSHPLLVRIVAQNGEAYDSREVTNCDPFRAVAPPVDGRYHVQIAAVNRTEEVFYSLAALIQS